MVSTRKYQNTYYRVKRFSQEQCHILQFYNFTLFQTSMKRRLSLPDEDTAVRKETPFHAANCLCLSYVLLAVARQHFKTFTPQKAVINNPDFCMFHRELGPYQNY